MAKNKKTHSKKEKKSTINNDSQKKELILRYKDDEKRKAFVSTKYKILQNKKAMAKLSSADMLILAELLEQEKEFSTKRMQDQLRNYAMLKIKRTFNGEIPQDEDFGKLVQSFGNVYQNDAIRKQNKEKEEILRKAREEQLKKKEQEKEKKEKKKEPKKVTKEGWFKRKWKAIKRGCVIVGIAALGFIGFKGLNNNPTETSSNNDSVPTPTEQTITPPKNVEKTDTVVNTELSNAINLLDAAYKDRFDTALETHLGVEKRDKLYEQIDKFAQDGKIVYKDGTTREWYAHAFTMYALVAPNSEGGKTIASFLAGEDVSPQTLNDLVINAQRDGSGIKGTGKHSNFEKASPDLQQRHIKNRQNVKKAEQNFQQIQQKYSR